eukprot:COSAG02_NODE_28052_length_597_cov_1.068273_1_plen_46_part_01
MAPGWSRARRGRGRASAGGGRIVGAGPDALGAAARARVSGGIAVLK